MWNKIHKVQKWVDSHFCLFLGFFASYLQLFLKMSTFPQQQQKLFLKAAKKRGKAVDFSSANEEKTKKKWMNSPRNPSTYYLQKSKTLYCRNLFYYTFHHLLKTVCCASVRYTEFSLFLTCF